MNGPNTKNHRIIGFDARTLVGVDTLVGVEESWPLSRVERYLLRRDIVQPLSTDTTVWKSVANENGAEMAPWHGVLNHWSSLSELLQFMQGCESTPITGWCIVAVALPWHILDIREQEAWAAPDKLVATQPARLDRSWEFLGYDISDTWLLSGLTNCGYSDAESRILRANWSRRLNMHHLFNNPKDAIKFRNMTNVRVPSHAPFHVFSIFRLQDYRRKGP